jgi:hypothetical protein
MFCGFRTGSFRYYEPDFVALINDGTHYIIETKDLEDVNVANKDRAAQLWCEIQQGSPASRGLI